jgi:hypothetical protein
VLRTDTRSDGTGLADSAPEASNERHQTMTEETDVIHALRWWRRLRRLAESRLDAAIARRSAAAAIRPARCAGDPADVAEQLLAEWRAAGAAAVEGDLRILSVALLAFSDQLAAEDRDQRGDTAWAGEATAAAAYSLAARDIADLTPRRNPGGRLTALASGLRELHGWLAICECTGSEVPRRSARRPAPRRGRRPSRPAGPGRRTEPRRRNDGHTSTRDTPVGVADEATRNAAVALCVIPCLAEREPVVIAA